MNRDKTSQFKETTSEEAEKLASQLSNQTIDDLMGAENEAEVESILLDDPNGSYVASLNNIAKQNIFDEEENPDKFFLKEQFDENGNAIGYGFDKDEFDEALRQTDEDITKEANGDKDKEAMLYERRALAQKASKKA